MISGPNGNSGRGDKIWTSPRSFADLAKLSLCRSKSAKLSIGRCGEKTMTWNSLKTRMHRHEWRQCDYVSFLCRIDSHGRLKVYNLLPCLSLRRCLDRLSREVSCSTSLTRRRHHQTRILQQTKKNPLKPRPGRDQNTERLKLFLSSLLALQRASAKSAAQL